METIDTELPGSAADDVRIVLLLQLEEAELHKLTIAEKQQHFFEGIFRAIEAAGRESRGQPPMVDRFRKVLRLVEQLEATGVPFGVSSTSIMNQRVRSALNEKAKASNDPRKSRRKRITPTAVRKWLRDVRKLRMLEEHFTKMYPYSD